MQASEITHYLIQVSEDVAPLKSVSTHLRIATYNLIPGHIRICKYMHIHHLAGPWPFRKLQRLATDGRTVGSNWHQKSLTTLFK